MDVKPITCSDGYVGHCRQWPGDRGAVLYLHGIQSHGRWFEGSAEHLAGKGYSVLLPDRRGSGANDVDRGDVVHRQRWLDDCLDMCRHLRSETGVDHVHVIGVSWGGKLGTAFAVRYPTWIQSLTLVAPGIFPKVDLPLREKLTVAACGLFRPRRQIAIPLNEPELFTDNEAKRAFIAGDQRRLTTVTARFLVQSSLLDAPVRRYDRRLDFPVKLFVAGRDQIIDNGPTLGLFRSWRTERKSLTVYAEACHTLEFETNPTRYYNDLTEWLDGA